MSDVNVNLLYVVDKVIAKLEGRKGVLNLDFDDELVNDIRLEMADTIREAIADAQKGRQSLPLTPEQIEELWQSHTKAAWDKTLISPTVFARMIESAHGIVST